MVCHEQKGGKRETSRQRFYIPRLKSQIELLLGNAKKLYASRFYRFKNRHGAIRNFAEQRRVVELPKC